MKRNSSRNLLAFTAGSLFFALNPLYGQTQKGKIVYKIEITNITKAQPLTPPVIAVHAPSTSLFELGVEASPGLKALSRDGDTSKIQQELVSNYAVKRFSVGDGVILPGTTASFSVEANDTRYGFSLVSMLARTNDAFTGYSFLQANLKKGATKTVYGNVYDAGAEVNSELCSDIPAPPCGNPNSGEDETSSFVHAHPGLHFAGDLEPTRDGFGPKAVKIKVTRTH